MRILIALCTLCAVVLTFVNFGTEDGKQTYTVELRLQDHVFYPSQVHVPAGQAIKLIVENADELADEFESNELNREKLLPPKTKTIVMLKPLKKGRYAFVAEFHGKEPGVIIAE